MGATTGIAWTRSSFNPWIGCTEVSPGCDNCYARTLDARHKYGGKTHWGVCVPRHRTSVHYWQQPLRWNKVAAMELETGRCVDWHKPGFWPVFPSLCDPFDNEVPVEWHGDFWRLIRATPHLTWLLLTKRVGNVAKMHPGGDYQNVWLGASIVNQEEADRDIPKLLATPAAKRFVSYEPALGPVNFDNGESSWLSCNGQNRTGCDDDEHYCCESNTNGLPHFRGIDQIIVGGESSQGGKQARPFNIEWARSTVRQCREAGVACFVKQLGSQPLGDYSAFEKGIYPITLKDRAGADPAEWPSDLRVQEFPKIT